MSRATFGFAGARRSCAPRSRDAGIGTLPYDDDANAPTGNTATATLNEIDFVASDAIEWAVNVIRPNVELKDDGKSLTVAIKLKDVTTGIAVRDKHMHEDMGAAQHPDCSLAVPLDQLKIPEEGKSVEAEAKGTFTLRGKAKELAFKYRATCSKGSCDVDGTADVNVKDHDIKIRSYLGITVKNDIKVATRFTVAK